MAQVPASSHGLSTAGGTLTGPLTIDLSDDATNQRGLHVIFPSTFDFSVEAFTFEIENQFGLFAFKTNGNVSTEGNGLRTSGGAVTTGGGGINAGTGGVTAKSFFATSGGSSAFAVQADAGTLAFFDVAAALQPAAIANAAGGVVIDAEARAALNTLLTAARTLGLITT